jgi:hypothetical protein
MQMKNVLYGCAAIICILCAPGVASAASLQYQFVDLSPSGTSESTGFGIGDGQQIGQAKTGARFHAFMWSGSKASAVDLTPAGFLTSLGSGAAGGFQVGAAAGFDGNQHAMLWHGTAASAVDLSGAWTWSVAGDIHGNQQVGGGRSTATANLTHALMWQGTAASVVDLHPVGFTDSGAEATSGAQQVGSGVSTAAGYLHALLWNGSAASALDLNPVGFWQSLAKGVAAGQQVGSGSPGTPLSPSHALLWQGTAASAVDLNPIGASLSEAYDTNGSFQVGYALIDNVYRATVWSGTSASAFDLQSFVPAGYTGSIAEGIDASGNIVGVVYDGSGVKHAGMWLAVPLPNAGVAGLALLAGSLCLARRRQVCH